MSTLQQSNMPTPTFATKKLFVGENKNYQNANT